MASQGIQQNHLVLFQETIERSLRRDSLPRDFWQRCTALRLGMTQINHMVDLKHLYKVSIRAVLRLLEGGATLDDVEVFCETREILASESDGVSLAMVARFYRKFGDGLDAVDLAARITALQDDLGCRFAGEVMARISAVVGADAIYPEAAIDFINGAPECWRVDS